MILTPIEIKALIEKANTYESTGTWQVLKPLEDYARAVIGKTPKDLSVFLRICILELNTYPAIRVLRATKPARSHSAEWRPFCVKTFYDYAKQVGEEKARTDMLGLTEGFLQ